MLAASEVQILEFSSELSRHFHDLNVEWLEKYFRVEPIDEDIMGNPQARVIDPGGIILFASMDDRVLGTVALKHHGDGVYELTKMAVTAESQGLGIGRRLMQACIGRFEQIGGRKLYLESHSSLAPALALYESAGFEHTDRPEPSDYERSDVYMVWRGEASIPAQTQK